MCIVLMRQSGFSVLVKTIYCKFVNISIYSSILLNNLYIINGLLCVLCGIINQFPTTCCEFRLRNVFYSPNFVCNATTTLEMFIIFWKNLPRSRIFLFQTLQKISKNEHTLFIKLNNSKEGRGFQKGWFFVT